MVLARHVSINRGPQIIVGLLAPWVGRTANTWGRRPLLLIGIGIVRVRAAFFALTAAPALLVVIQILDGLSGATLGVLTTLVIADLANGTGRFNLAQGLLGTLSGVGVFCSDMSPLIHRGIRSMHFEELLTVIHTASAASRNSRNILGMSFNPRYPQDIRTSNINLL